MTMTTALIMTIIGPDQTGLVKGIAEAASSHGASWEQSHMSHLAGQFAGILRIVCPRETVDALISDMRALETTGLKIEIIQDASNPTEVGQMLELDLIANDRSGLVNELAAAIDAAGCNIEELETEVQNSPWSGDLLFHATGIISLGDTSSRESLQENLEDLGLDFQVTLTETIG